jgi:hypothetical protein
VEELSHEWTHACYCFLRKNVLTFVVTGDIIGFHRRVHDFHLYAQSRSRH